MTTKDAEMKIRAPSLKFIYQVHNHPNHAKIKGRNIFLSLHSPHRLQVDHFPSSVLFLVFCHNRISPKEKIL